MRDDGIQPSLLKVIEAKQMKTRLNHNTTRHTWEQNETKSSTQRT